MHYECFAADDQLFKLIERASVAMHKLAIHVHYAARMQRAQSEVMTVVVANPKRDYLNMDRAIILWI